MNNTKPLAERIRPTNIENYYGKEALFEKYPFLKAMYENKFYRSAIFYGPSGSGKTTFALLLVQDANLPVVNLNAVTANKQDIMTVIEQSRNTPVLLILDEIHRLNKDKQELLLPVIESGAVVLFGLTTVHPNTSLPASIRSRVNIYHFAENSNETVVEALIRATEEDAFLQSFNKTFEPTVFTEIAQIAGGDIRYAMNTLEEIIVSSLDANITNESLYQIKGFSHSAVDNIKNHYDLLSALQKSIRGSNPDAAIYWLMRLTDTQDIPAITRRLYVIAFEDIAMGFPAAISRTIDAITAAEKIGYPEALFPLAYCVIELALAPKSHTVKHAISLTQNALEQYGNLPIPEVLKMRTIDRKDYYDYNNPKSWATITYLPESIKDYHFLDFSKEFRSGKYEKQLAEQYTKLQKK